MKFEYPEIEVVRFSVEDVITASSEPENTDPSITWGENDLGGW